MRTDLDTTRMNQGRSLSFWREAVCSNLVGVDCDAGSRTALKGRFTQLGHDGYAIARLRAEAHHVSRERAILRKSDTDFYMLFLQKAGTMRVQREGQDFAVRPGDMYFYDGRTEHRLSFDAAFDHLAVRIPRKVLERRWAALAEIGSFRACAGQGVVDRVLLPMAGSALGAAGGQDLPGVVTSLIDLFSGRLTGDSLPPASQTEHARLTLLRATRIVDQRIEDPDLSAEGIAAELGLSRRQLDRLLARNGTSFGEVLMARRMARAAELLAQPWSRGQSITRIALSSGIENHSFFTRKFRETFGQTPADYRKRRLAALASSPEQ